MTFDPNALSPLEVQAINAQASVLMKRGIRLLSDGQPNAVAEALICFDRALELRSGLPIHSDPILGYGLAACWLNREAAAQLKGAIEADQCLGNGARLTITQQVNATLHQHRRLCVDR